MMTNNYRNITLSTKVCANQKAEYVKIAKENGITLSEWIGSTIEINKHNYGKEGDPTKREIELEKEIESIRKKNARLIKDRESGDYRVAMEMKRADKAINERDEIRYQLKEMSAQVTDLTLKATAFEEEMKKNNHNNKQYNNETNSVAPLFLFISIFLGVLF